LTGVERDEDKYNLNEDFGDERSARNDSSPSGMNGRKPYHPNDYGSSKGPPDIIPSFAQHNISFLAGCSSSSTSSVTSSPSGLQRRLSLHLTPSSVTPVPPSLPSSVIPPLPQPLSDHHHRVLDDDEAQEGVIQEDTATSSSGLNDKNFSAFGQSFSPVEKDSLFLFNVFLLLSSVSLFPVLVSLSSPLFLSHGSSFLLLLKRREVFTSFSTS
jgi:hypothetical protein